MSDFKLDQFEAGVSTGIDAFFDSDPDASMTTRVKLASLTQLKGFKRISSDTLINTSTNDLWALRKEGNEFFIERLFKDGEPQKG